ncbi:CaiB/BaiF CoA transferase family protein [Chloroflexota bacterium]
MAKQIFEGVKVCDLAWWAAGPRVSKELALHGATVIKVESHRRLDGTRTNPPFKDGQWGLNRSGHYPQHNTNKYGITLDYSKPKGYEVAKRLIMWADIVADSMTPGSLAKRGLDYESVIKFKPDIIYFSTCQMGQHGPLSNFGAMGQFGAAYGGYSDILGYPDRGPLPLQLNYPDLVAPWYTVVALIGALLHRRKTGKGMYLDHSQIEAGALTLTPLLLDYAVNGRIAGRIGNHDPYMCPHNAYPCRGDDRWVVIAVKTDEEWQALCRVIGEPEWSQDPKFSTLLNRKDNEEELDSLIGEWTRDYSPEQLMATMQAAEVPAGVMLTSGEGVVNDPQAKHRQHYRWENHTEMGSVIQTSPTYRLSKTPAHISRAAPCIGEDNEYVYKEILGYSDDEIADLMIEGVITTEADPPGASR